MSLCFVLLLHCRTARLLSLRPHDDKVMSSKSPFDRLSDEIDGLREEIATAVAALNEARRDPKRAEELSGLEKDVEDLKVEKIGVLATRDKLFSPTTLSHRPISR